MVPLDSKKSRAKRIDLLKAIKNTKRKKEVISTMNDDPFDMFYNSCEKEETIKASNHTEVVPKESENKKNFLGDEDFLTILTTNKETVNDHEKAKQEYGIFERMKVYSNENIVFREKKMYKFPFEINIKYEASCIFKSLLKLFITSLKSIFKKYKKNGDNFYVKIGTEILHFSKVLTVTKGFEKVLKNNDIKYAQIDEYLHVTGVDISIVVDYILNVKVDTFYVIPFILSETPFENSIFYNVVLRRNNIVKENNQVLFSYTLEGPFWMEHFKDFLKFKYKIM